MPTMLVAYPAMLRCRTWMCDYCNGPFYQELWSSFGGARGLLVCEEHLAWGKRDIRASWHRSNVVTAEDLIANCPDLSGARLNLQSFAYREDDGKWFMQMDEHGLLAELEGNIKEKLEQGIYKEDMMAFQLALRLEKERLAQEVATKDAMAKAAVAEAKMQKEQQKQESAGNTRLGESKDDMLKRLTEVALVERPYECDIPGCMYAAKTSSAIKKHKRTHREEPASKTASTPTSDFDESSWTAVGH